MHGKSGRHGVLMLVWVGACSQRPAEHFVARTAVTPVAAALSGEDGVRVVGAPGTVLNTYAALTVDAPAGALGVTVDSAASLTGPAGEPLGPGDLVLIIQMQGATLSTVNTAAYGAVTNWGGAGLYEFTRVASIHGNTLTLDPGCSGLLHAYSAAGATQVVRVPQYATLEVTAGASVTAPAWNGNTGGVVALHVAGTLTVDGALDVSALGFRGGPRHQGANDQGENETTYRSTSDTAGGQKGESVAGQVPPNGAYGRGAPANGGGGGNAYNSGGGGGANASAPGTWNGAGVMDPAVLGGAAWPLDPWVLGNGDALAQSPGGGRGGYSSSRSNQDALTVGPGVATWGGNQRRERGGLGGHPVDNNVAARLFVGGGGGAGDTDDQTGGAGGAGGGLLLVRASRVVGAGVLRANGGAGGDSAASPSDGPGGGGGGGTVVVRALVLNGVTLEAQGGPGGSQRLPTGSSNQEAQGPGGGGGGGYISAGLAGSVSAGAAGTTASTALTEFPVNGATGGMDGVVDPGALPLLLCPGHADATVTVDDGVNAVLPGATLHYAITVSVAANSPVGRVQLLDTLPAVLQNASWSCAGGAGVCDAPAGAGALNTWVLVAPGNPVTLVLTAQLASNATGTVRYQVSATVPLDVDDANLANNVAADVDTVGQGNQPPVLHVPGLQTTAEDIPLTFFAAPANSITVEDPDAAGGLLRLSLAPTAGTVTLGNTVMVTLITGSGSGDTNVVFEGTLSALNTALDGLVFQPWANFAGAAGVALTLNDLGNTGGAAQEVQASIPINVLAQNDPPVLGLPVVVVLNPGQSASFTAGRGTAITVTDVDVGAGNMAVTLQATGGEVSVVSQAGMVFTQGNGSLAPSLSFTGGLAVVQAALASTLFTPSSGVTQAALRVAVDDQGNTGAGGPLTAAGTVRIEVILQSSSGSGASSWGSSSAPSSGTSHGSGGSSSCRGVSTSQGLSTSSTSAAGSSASARGSGSGHVTSTGGSQGSTSTSLPQSAGTSTAVVPLKAYVRNPNEGVTTGGGCDGGCQGAGGRGDGALVPLLGGLLALRRKK